MSETVLAHGKSCSTSITRPISVPVSPSSAVECYPCREITKNYSESRLFHGGDTVRLPQRSEFPNLVGYCRCAVESESRQKLKPSRSFANPLVLGKSAGMRV